MTDTVHPYIQLRKTIRQAGKQFRKSNDNSTSMFHPEGGFIYGYEMEKVEDALNEYEATLPTEFLSVDSAAGMESRLLQDAQQIVNTSEDMAMRDFARQVMAYLVIHEGQQLAEPVRDTPSLFEVAS